MQLVVLRGSPQNQMGPKAKHAQQLFEWVSAQLQSSQLIAHN